MNRFMNGWVNGFIGVAIFAGSLPATRVAVMGFEPGFLTAARAAIAGILGLILILVLKQKKPAKQDWPPLAIVAIGVVIGFPLFTALALQYMNAAHSIVFVSLLPLATAIFAVLRGGEKPNQFFWIFAVLGSAVVFAYMFFISGDTSLGIGDFYMLMAIIFCGFGYAEGGVLSRKIGGWQVICWALILSLPFMLFLTIFYMPTSFQNISASAVVGLVYVSLFSMLIGFFFWYKGLAQGGIAAISQLQLLQPLMGLAIAAALLHEHVSWSMLVVTAATLLCVAAAKKFA
ncbi:DMT family transporter [Acinetobacter sp. V91_7]|uniref:DMT family transporter n=1 Tax=unclassified Acinetobacter TaxID=196816 RepID=UPI00287E9898|nr:MULTISPECIES: DMT family transporter [unclassified Acinetobacter]MDS7935348.1 DMT family transporter [Acinetobacter sp. V91_4B]MDS7962480.1 DMT family transporter [Acinetobacter sp. V91_7]MDS8026385.1 DMT family transporter [Acinetobacter sp. V91_13]